MQDRTLINIYCFCLFFQSCLFALCLKWDLNSFSKLYSGLIMPLFSSYIVWINRENNRDRREQGPNGTENRQGPNPVPTHVNPPNDEINKLDEDKDFQKTIKKKYIK